jgi:prepilin-type N-terminal cleavage/methylation domain-containing protein
MITNPGQIVEGISCESGRSPGAPRAHLSAFSLIELLVVMAIMALLLAAGMTMFRTPTSTLVQGAVETSAGMVDLAQRQAQVANGGSRLVVDIDPQSPNYLRSLAVLSAKTATTPVQWELRIRPQILRQEAQMYPKYSLGQGTMRFDFRSGAAQDGNGSGTLCQFWEFDSNGQLVTSASGASQQIVFVAGVISGGPPYSQTVADSREPGRDGVILRKSGGVTRFDSPDQIQQTTP